MTQPAPKRYAYSLIKHFIIVALFFPTFYSYYNNEYYQDLFFSNIIAFFFFLNIIRKWTIDFKRNQLFVILLSILLLLYNLVSIYNFTAYDVYFWKMYPVNITIAFLFFLCLLQVRDHKDIVNDKVIKLMIYSIIVHTLLGFHYRLHNGSRLFMMNFRYTKTMINPDNEFFCWMYHDASEYALILILSMAFFIIYS